MPRKRRIHYPGAIYHVMLRGNAKQDIFYRDEAYQYFETILDEARAMTAMTGMDHCHYLLSDFAVYFNRSMPCMSRLVKAVRGQMAKKLAMQEKMRRIKNQISAIRQA